MSTPSTSGPLLATVACIAVGIVLALVGFNNARLIGGAVSAIGVIPAAWASWAGMQQKGQGSLVAALLLLFASLGVAALLIILWVVGKF